MPPGGASHLECVLPSCRFPEPGTPVDLAVSGGADSMALLLLAAAHGLVVTVHHVDHGIRADSHRDIETIAPVAARLGAQLLVHRVEVPGGPNLESRARGARFAAMPSTVMTAHTADDQAETVLINLLRGAGATGLAAMRPGARHPLLALRRSDTVAVCEEAGLVPVIDTSNDDAAHQRNRIRHELIPLLASIASRDVVPLIVRSADHLRTDDDLLEELAAVIDPRDADALAAAPTALSSRAIRAWLSDPYPPDTATIERVMRVARGEIPGCDIGQGREVRRTNRRLRVVPLG